MLTERQGNGARARLDGLRRLYVDFPLAERGMFELMFRHDLLESGRLGLRGAGLPLFGSSRNLVAEAVPAGDARRIAGALWAAVHGIAQLWARGSLRLAVGGDGPWPAPATALDARLGREPR